MTTGEQIRALEEAGWTVCLGRVLLMRGGAMFSVAPGALEQVAEHPEVLEGEGSDEREHD